LSSAPFPGADINRGLLPRWWDFSSSSSFIFLVCTSRRCWARISSVLRIYIYLVAGCCQEPSPLSILSRSATFFVNI
jgi:hypothetical protein